MLGMLQSRAPSGIHTWILRCLPLLERCSGPDLERICPPNLAALRPEGALLDILDVSANSRKGPIGPKERERAELMEFIRQALAVASPTPLSRAPSLGSRERHAAAEQGGGHCVSCALRARGAPASRRSLASSDLSKPHVVGVRGSEFLGQSHCRAVLR